jgi:putative transcriptional regulator
MDEQKIDPGPGVILIAHPWLPDPNFARMVVLLCDHRADEGTFGLVLSRRLDHKVGEVVETLADTDHALFLGGPVQPNTLHFLHRREDELESAIRIQDGLAWGGDFDLVQAMLIAGDIDPADIRFFAGYSGWGPGQLEEEIEEGSWILTTAPTDIVMDTEVENLWRVLLRRMGGPYALLANFPVDPRQN